MEPTTESFAAESIDGTTSRSNGLDLWPPPFLTESGSTEGRREL
jgi:hypothetical protein